MIWVCEKTYKNTGKERKDSPIKGRLRKTTSQTIKVDLEVNNLSLILIHAI